MGKSNATQMKELFQVIQNKLISDVPELAMIDFDLGQLEQEPLPPLSYPALLISFNDALSEDIGGRSQETNVTISMQIAFRVFERTHSIAQSEWRAVGLGHLDIVDKVRWCLHGFEGDCFRPLSKRGFFTVPRADLRVYILTFETLITETPPNPQYVSWTQSGGQGIAPDLCLTDDAGNIIN